MQGQRHFELEMLASFDIKELRQISPITAIESKNQMVFFGRRTISDTWSVYMYLKNLVGTVDVTQMDTPCQHDTPFYCYNPVTLVQNGKELLTVFCIQCKDIRLVDIEKKQITHVYQLPPDSPSNVYPGPNGGLFVTFRRGNIQQLDSSFRTINTFNVGQWSRIGTSNYRGVNYNCLPTSLLCYLPAPHNTLVVNKVTNLRAISVQDARQVWSQKYEMFWPKCLLFCPQQDVLLVSDDLEPQVRVLNPSDGSILQTIEIPNIRRIVTMCLCNDQIVMIQRAEKDTLRGLLSYYNFKKHF